MSDRKPEYGLLIDYEYCTGCHACEIACSQEYKRPPGMMGIQVIEVIQRLPHDRAYLAYLPFPTELCILCRPRTRKGLEPACVQHCMAACMKYGRIEDLAKEMGTKPRMVLWSPRC
jgi:Fe-S-cluster-containing dehydrogenase component